MSLTPEALRAAADEAVAAWEGAQALEPFSRRLPGFDLEDGYAVMEHLHAHRLAMGWRPVGRKIGFTNTRIWDRYGVHHPIWGWVYDRTLLPEAVDLQAGYECPLAGLVQPRIEPEIVMGLAHAPPADGDLQGVLESVAWIAHGFEIVQSHYPDWRFAAADSVAFGSLHGRLMVGPRLRPQELGGDAQGVLQALAAFELGLWRLQADGEGAEGRGQGGSAAGVEIDRGQGANVLGNPLAAIAHLQALLAKQAPDRMMQAGEIVTTGTVTDAHAVAPGQAWATRITGIGLPGLQVRFRP